MNRAEYYDTHETRDELEAIAQDPEVANENREICTACGGRCCKRHPGMFLPSDFGATVNQIKKHVTDCIRKGKVQFDYWEGDFEGHLSPKYVRASTKDGIGKIVSASWGGECAFLQVDGCELSFNDRPAECRDLVPGPDGKDCHLDTLNKRALIWAWIPHQGMIAEIIAELEREAKQCV